MKKILIADDSFYQRKVLGGLVTELGHAFEAVTSGEELMEKLDESYDCIFLDLLMSGMTGMDVLAELKKMDNVPPIIVISADVQQKRQEECLELGAAAFIEKIVSKEELEQTLSKIFN